MVGQETIRIDPFWKLYRGICGRQHSANQLFHKPHDNFQPLLNSGWESDNLGLDNRRPGFEAMIFLKYLTLSMFCKAIVS